MNYHYQSGLGVALAAGFILLSGCNDGGSTSNSVVGVSLDNSVIERGNSSVVKVDFSFDADDILTDNHTVAIVIHLPSGVTFHPDSGDIEQVLGDDNAVGAELFACSGGDMYVTFNLNRSDLVSANNPSGNADARITFTIDAVAPVNASIDARAGSEAVFSCDSEFEAQSSAAVEVI